LHDSIEELTAKNIRVYGISYDPQSSLKEFSEQYGVTYNLLSDIDSAVIKKLGILNTLVSPDDTEKHPWTRRGFYGIPFPGVYVTDESGVVTEKFFYRHYATRASAGTVINSSLGEVLRPKEAPQTDFSDDRVKITVFLADESLKFEYRSALYVRFELAKGLHIYGDPLPDGFVSTTVSIDETKGLRTGAPRYPNTKTVEFDALNVTLNVYEGVVDVAIPVSLTAELMNWTIRDKPESIEIPLTVRYQACSYTVCYPPKTEKLSVTVPVSPLLMPGARNR
jgi:peroxiredoxin